MTREDPDPNWGGAREGAGRPTEGEEPLSVQLSLRVTKTIADRIDTQREDGESRATAARRLIEERLDQLEG